MANVLIGGLETATSLMTRPSQLLRKTQFWSTGGRSAVGERFAPAWNVGSVSLESDDNEIEVPLGRTTGRNPRQARRAA